MKNKIVSLIAGFTTLTSVLATDHIVQEGGAMGTFSSISSAISTAIDGDRIIIHPKTGGNAWVEALTIDKSLELISSQDGAMYKIQGDINVVGQNGRKVTIISAHIVSGDILGTTSNTWKTEVNILGCQLDGGKVRFYKSYDLTLVSTILLNGDVEITIGDAIGNELLGNRIFIHNASNNSDTVNIIANKVKNIHSASPNVVNLINNFIYFNVSQTDFYSIRFGTAPLSGKIINNTICAPSSTSSSFGNLNYFIYDFNVNSVYDNLLIQNNIFVKTTSSSSPPYFDSGLSSSTVASNYNYYYVPGASGTISNNSSEITLTSNPVTSSGVLITPTAAQDGANPAFEFYDLDLTVGDAGCYGGSYTLANYFPITGSSRVFNIDMPFGIFTGGTLNIKAIGFDK